MVAPSPLAGVLIDAKLYRTFSIPVLPEFSQGRAAPGPIQKVISGYLAPLQAKARRAGLEAAAERYLQISGRIRYPSSHVSACHRGPKNLRSPGRGQAIHDTDTNKASDYYRD
ncbi:hypothetical protein PoB_005183000 [Plakobranchus ocellatus]|uniref:Uncharacterized protein n=1 Tax=Plakobranchus ocellatus TaxID=259542 RepID=A0AAV4C140_9GAST|nr:hypothetical protein PoB_005183000 [Plakobranchus ocellatus]